MSGTFEQAGVRRSGGLGYMLLLVFVATLGGLLFGYDTAVINGAINYVTAAFGLDAYEKGWAAASALVGCIVGALFAGVLSDWLGRKKVLILCAVLFAISAIGSAIPDSLSFLAWARIIGGLGVGAASMLSPLYIAEIAPAHLRGRLVSLNQLTIVSGMLLVFFVNFWVAGYGEAQDRLSQGSADTAVVQAASPENGEVIDPASWNVRLGWRWMFGSETLPAVLFLVFLFFVPESPRWLMKRGRKEEASRILTRINGPDVARRETAEIAEAIALEGASLRQLLHPNVRVVLGIGVILAVLQQITGINVILYYSADIFQAAGLNPKDALMQNVIVGAVNVLFTLIAIWVVDRLGRRPLLLGAAAGMGLFMFLVGGCFNVGATDGPWVLLFVLGYVASFAVAMGPVVWVVLSEVFPTRVRGTAMSVAVVLLWTANYFVTQFYPPLMEAIGGSAYHLFGVMCVLAFLFIWFFVPETKGKTLEEIERHWLREEENHG